MPEQEKLEDLLAASVSLGGPASTMNSDSWHVAAKDIDSGEAMEYLARQYAARIRQLKEGLSSSQLESDHVLDEYIMQNLQLLNMNKSLEAKVVERTRELAVANDNLLVSNASLQEANSLLEDQARELKMLGEAKEALMHMIVHDMKNPMTAILSGLALFTKNSFDLKPDIHNLLLAAHANSLKLLSMIEEILIVSRMESKEFQLKPGPADLSAVLAGCVELMKKAAAGKDVKFHYTPAAKPINAVCDVQIIERVINNLLNNATKYAPAGSEILSEIEAKAGRVSISVTNWGEPIPSEYHDKIFDMFTRVNAKDRQFSGTGLGLAFCRLAVEAHRGTIRVISPVPPLEFGACFVFSLPLAGVPGSASVQTSGSAETN